jgi:NAD(P)-dependent dehydrogenase (short-subunit alcohol dehydrogenase family)
VEQRDEYKRDERVPVLPRVRAVDERQIINMTSMMSHISLPGRIGDSASETALPGFNRALALELAGEKITVNGISPGVWTRRSTCR